LDYNEIKAFEWSPDKSDRCLADRGFDFEYAVNAFLDPGRIVTIDMRHDYGETRYQLLGAIRTRVYVVIFTVRSGVIRIISARKANQRERMRYENGQD
jgi:uncharacterized DUF497 family protein